MIVNPVKESKVTFGARLLLYCYNFYSPFGFSQLYLTRFYFSKLIQMIVDMEAEFQNVDSFFFYGCIAHVQIPWDQYQPVFQVKCNF